MDSSFELPSSKATSLCRSKLQSLTYLLDGCSIHGDCPRSVFTSFGTFLCNVFKLNYVCQSFPDHALLKFDKEKFDKKAVGSVELSDFAVLHDPEALSGGKSLTCKTLKLRMSCEMLLLVLSL